jgi:hypothetical protein
MASKADKIREINKLLKETLELNSQEKQYYQDQTKALQDKNASAEQYDVLLGDINTRTSQIGGNLNSWGASLMDSVKAFNQISTSTNQQLRATKKLTSLSEKSVDVRKGEEFASKRNLSSLKEQAKSQLKILESSKGNYDLRTKAGRALKSDIEAAQGVVKNFEKLEEVATQTNAELGVAPILAAGIDKSLSKIGLPSLGLDDAYETTHKLKQEAAATGKNISTWGTYASVLKKNLNDAFTPMAAAQMTLTFIFSIMKGMDESAGKLAKGMNMSYNQGVQLNKEFKDVANASGDVMINAKGLEESLLSINQSMGTNAMISDSTLKTFTKLRETSGLTNEELMGAQKLSFANGQSLRSNVDTILKTTTALKKQTGVAINEKDVLKDIGKLSAATTLSLGKNPKELAKAVATAKSLGLEMSKLENIADGLLDFESSIEAELEAELLTGKNLTLEKARQAALNNDMATLAEEIADQAGSAAEFSKMNRIQQEAMAKAVGMNREDLAQTLLVQEQLKGLSEEDAAKREELLNKRIKEVGLEQAQKELQEGGIELLEQQASKAEEFSAMVEKIKETFAGMADGPLGRILGMMGTLLQNTTAVYSIVGLIAGIYGGKMLIGLGKSIAQAGVMLGLTTAKAVAEMTAMSALTLGLGVAAVIGGLIAGTAAMNNAIGGSKKNDMFAPGDGSNGYGKRTLYGPEGAIQLNNKDTVIAGTDLFGDDTLSTPGEPTKMVNKGEIELKPKTQPSPQINMSVTNSKLDAILAAIQKGSIIEMDGAKMGETINQGARAIQ